MAAALAQLSAGRSFKGFIAGKCDIIAHCMNGRYALGLILVGVFALSTFSIDLSAATVMSESVKVLIDHNSDTEHANPGFYFAEAPTPSTNDADTTATFRSEE